MKNFVQEGDMLTLAAPYQVAAGDGALVGSIFGISEADLANGASGQFATQGVFDITALSTDTGTVGTAVYWDNTNKRITTTASGNTKVGVLAAAKSNGDTYAVVRLNGTF